MKDARIHLLHILDCIAAIDSYAAGGRAAFLADRRTHKATLRELQELAESTQRLPEPVKARRPEIPWADIAGFRNVIVHDYLGLDLGRVWDIVTRDLPPLKDAVEALLRESQEGPV